MHLWIKKHQNDKHPTSKTVKFSRDSFMSKIILVGFGLIVRRSLVWILTMALPSMSGSQVTKTAHGFWQGWHTSSHPLITTTRVNHGGLWAYSFHMSQIKQILKLLAKLLLWSGIRKNTENTSSKYIYILETKRTNGHCQKLILMYTGLYDKYMVLLIIFTEWDYYKPVLSTIDNEMDLAFQFTWYRERKLMLFWPVTFNAFIATSLNQKRKHNQIH